MNPYPSFGDLGPECSAYPASRVAILPVPFERTTTYRKGTRRAPRAILEASTNLELYDEELQQETFRIGIHTCPFLDLDTDRSEEALARIEDVVRGLVEDGKFPVLIGGEHTLTIGAVRALLRNHPTLHVLQLDAHADLRDEYQGNPFSHACTMRRVRELCPVSQVGIRSLSAEEAREIERLNGRLHFAHEMIRNDLWMPQVLEELRSPLYLTVDMDFFDPSEVPSVGTPEPGGFGWYETLPFLRKVMETKEVIGFDVVELCPGGESTASTFFAAKLVYRLIGYRFPSSIG